MIDEKKIIARFRKVVNEFIEKHPDKANGLEVKVINTFIELLQEETRDTDILNNMTNADENDKNINIPDEAYFIKDGQIQSGFVQEVVYSICRKTLLDIRYDDNSLDSYRGYLGNEVFLTKAEAEQKLKEMESD